MAAMSDDYTETASFLIEKGAKIDAKNQHGETLLYMPNLTWSKDYNVLELLIQKGADVNELSPNVYALFVASENGDEKLAKILIESNADINTKSAIRCYTPLFWAATSNQKNIVHFLMGLWPKCQEEE